MNAYPEVIPSVQTTTIQYYQLANAEECESDGENGGDIRILEHMVVRRPSGTLLQHIDLVEDNTCPNDRRYAIVKREPVRTEDPHLHKEGLRTLNPNGFLLRAEEQ